MALPGTSYPPTILRAVVLLSLFSITVQTTNCTQSFVISEWNKTITNCKKLGTLGAELGWNFGIRKRTIDVVFGVHNPEPEGWVAWGVNPGSRPQMVGTRALIGFQHPINGSLLLETYNVTVDTAKGCNFEPFEPSEEIDFKVQNREILYLPESGFFLLSATITLPEVYNLASLNHVWQVGPSMVDMVPQMHAMTLQNVDSAETINLYSGDSQIPGPEQQQLRQQLRKVHGILSIVGWGTISPLGTIVARYTKEFPMKYRGWYSLHVFSHIFAYLVGVVGWAIGLWLGSASKDTVFSTHRSLGIVIFTFTTLQMLALWLRPHENDEHKRHWRLYHHVLGYALIALIIVNIFEGIQLPTDHWKWKGAYLGILVVLASVVVVLEAFTWSKHILYSLKYSPSSPTD